MRLLPASLAVRASWFLALALVALDDQCEEIKMIGFRRTGLRFVLEVALDTAAKQYLLLDRLWRATRVADNQEQFLTWTPHRKS